MIKRSLIIVRNVALVSMFLYGAGHLLAAGLPEDCFGADCEVVTCPDNMAVNLGDGRYLPCEKFEEYKETEDERLLVK